MSLSAKDPYAGHVPARRRAHLWVTLGLFAAAAVCVLVVASAFADDTTEVRRPLPEPAGAGHYQAVISRVDWEPGFYRYCVGEPTPSHGEPCDAWSVEFGPRVQDMSVLPVYRIGDRVTVQTVIDAAGVRHFQILPGQR